MNNCLHVCPLQDLEAGLKKPEARHLVSLMGPGKEMDCPSSAVTDYLSLSFNDIVEPRDGLIAPSEDVVTQLIAFARKWGGHGTMVVHCWMGISRSTAAATIIQQTLNPGRAENNIAHELRQLSPMATPNRLMIAHADRLLKRDGKLLSAIDAIGRGEDASIGKPFDWPLSGVIAV